MTATTPPPYPPLVTQAEGTDLPCVCVTPSVTTCEFCQVFGGARLGLALAASNELAPSAPNTPTPER